MTVNPYFTTKDSHAGQQNLIEDLVIESIQIMGIEAHYMPRTLIDEDKLFGEDRVSAFTTANPIEMYVETFSGFEGSGDLFSKFGVQINDQIKFMVAKKQFKKLVPNITPNADRPREGDLIFFPYSETIFEIKFVEDEQPFYQGGKLYVYELQCELFDFSQERFNTGITNIDDTQRKAAFAIDLTMNGGSGTYTSTEQVYQGASLVNSTVRASGVSWNATTKILRVNDIDGTFVISSNVVGANSAAEYTLSSFDDNEFPTDQEAINKDIETEADLVLNFDETNPFGNF